MNKQDEVNNVAVSIFILIAFLGFLAICKYAPVLLILLLAILFCL